MRFASGPVAPLATFLNQALSPTSFARIASARSADPVDGSRMSPRFETRPPSNTLCSFRGASLTAR
ncbi:hypothetical protein GCM10009559_42780 [Pseudonocardia zijingensis]|uniref:Uncharacterized protein n=1 Tax=Pseudonocardia zijingensis TaxID=153376 RepID=A0ABP4B8G6_9PSEU